MRIEWLSAREKVTGTICAMISTKSCTEKKCNCCAAVFQLKRDKIMPARSNHMYNMFLLSTGHNNLHSRELFVRWTNQSTHNAFHNGPFWCARCTQSMANLVTAFQTFFFRHVFFSLFSRNECAAFFSSLFSSGWWWMKIFSLSSVVFMFITH